MANTIYQQLIGSFGLNLRNTKSSNDDTFLISAKNVVCRAGYIESRKHTKVMVSFNDPVRFIYDFNQYNIIVVATDTTISIFDYQYNLIKQQSGFSDGDWVPCMFNNRLFLANSLDETQNIYQDVNLDFIIAPIDVTGAGTKVFSFISAVNSQLCFGIRNKMEMWYLEVGAIAGILKIWDLSTAIGTTRLGGYLVGMYNVPRDSGLGMLDHIAFFTNKGEIIVYQSNDFSDPDAINYNGTYNTQPFIGYTFITKFLNDLILQTTQGVTTFQTVINAGIAVSTEALFSAEINTAWQNQNFKLNGYTAAVVPSENFLIFNVPKEYGKSVQWIKELSSNNWSSFIDINANYLTNANNKLLFATNRGIEEYTNNAIPQDDDHWIISEIQTSFANWGTLNNKQFNLFKCGMLANTKMNINFSIKKEFSDISYYDFVSDSNLTPTINQTNFFWTIDDILDIEHELSLAYWYINDDVYDNVNKTAFFSIGDTDDFSEQAGWHSGTGLSKNFSLVLAMKTNNVVFKLYDMTYRFTESRGAL